MTKKTNEAKYKTMSAALSLNRALLATTKDAAQVRYHYEKLLELETTSDETNHATLPNVTTPQPVQPQQTAPAVSSSNGSGRRSGNVVGNNPRSDCDQVEKASRSNPRQ
jgi:hypothetical protein